MITKRGTRGRIAPGGATGGSAKGRTYVKVSAKSNAPDGMAEFMPPTRAKGYDDSPGLAAVRAVLTRRPEPPRTGPEIRVSVKEPDPVTPQIEPEPIVAPEAEYEDPSVAVKMDETLADIIGVARRNRVGYTGDDPRLKPITWRRAFNTIFASWFGRVEADGTVIPRNDPRFAEGEDTFYNWFVVGLALFGEKMSRQEREVFERFTGRKNPPTKQVRELWLALARRSGKNHFAVAVIVFIACLRRHGLRRGQLALVMLLALDREQAGESFRMLADLLLSIPSCAAMIVGGSTDRTMSVIKLANRVSIQVMVASPGSVRARAAVFILADEIAWWATKEGSARLDKHILSAIRPTRWGMRNALLLCLSSPRAKKGALYEASKQRGIETVTTRSGAQIENPVLYWQAPTDTEHLDRVLATGLDMRPTRDPDFLSQLEADYIADPLAFVSEGLGQFRSDLESYITVEAVEAVMVKGQTVLPYTFGYRHIVSCDPAGGTGKDSATVSVTRVIERSNLVSGAKYKFAEIALLREWRPPFNAVAVAAEVVQIAHDYKVKKIYGDHFSGGMWASLLKDAAPGISYEVLKETKSDFYRRLLPLITAGRVSFPGRDTAIGQRLIDQLTSLEVTGDIKIDTPDGSPEDVANSAAIGCVLAATKEAGYGTVASVTYVNGRIVNIINPGRAA